VAHFAEAKMRDAYQTRDKQARTDKLRAMSAEVIADLAPKLPPRRRCPDSVEVGNILFEMESKIVRSQILDGEPRIDGRDTRTVRPISIRTSVLPRTHGSALFTRGETQALVVAPWAPPVIRRRSTR
jgi:polyribonucleotide nucleotidyltransferase